MTDFVEASGTSFRMTDGVAKAALDHKAQAQRLGAKINQGVPDQPQAEGTYT